MNLITNNDKFLNIIFFYVIIIPFSLVLGDFTINLTIYSLSLLILLRSFLKNDWSYINFTLGKIFIFCWIYLIIISIFIHDINLKNITKSLVFGLNFIFL